MARRPAAATKAMVPRLMPATSPALISGPVLTLSGGGIGTVPLEGLGLGLAV